MGELFFRTWFCLISFRLSFFHDACNKYQLRTGTGRFIRFFAMVSAFNGQSAMTVEIYQVVSSVFFETGPAFNGQSAMNVDIYLFYGLFTPKRHFKTDFIK